MVMDGGATFASADCCSVRLATGGAATDSAGDEGLTAFLGGGVVGLGRGVGGLITGPGSTIGARVALLGVGGSAAGGRVSGAAGVSEIDAIGAGAGPATGGGAEGVLPVAGTDID